MSIHILSDDLASKIAAGEVIERPASVVKELIENALDAGARDVRLEVRGGGQRLIRVADDGSGILFDDVPTAFARHGTSKLASADDLFAIRTLGFRGEALPSIASVARVTLITRADAETHGAIFKVENAQTRLHQSHGAPRGAVITVEDLFHNVPARLKFLKSPGAENAHIAEMVHAYALAYPRVRFSLVTDGKLVFQTAGSGKLSDVLLKVYGSETARAMLEVPSAASETAMDEQTAIEVYGYITPPSIHRGNRRLQYLFVNGRWVDDRALAHAVTEAYHTLLMVGRFPLFVLNVQLPPEAVDVNVHPTKMQVRFREPHEVFRAVQRATRRALNEKFPMPTLAFSSNAAPHLGAPSFFAMPARAALNLIPPTQADSAQLELDARTFASAHPSAAADSLPMLRVLGQIFSTYIVCEGPDGLYLVDQHAAHERVLYDKWQTERAQNFTAQDLLEPVPVELAPAQFAAYESEREHLARAGFRLEPFGGATLLLRAVPTLLQKRDPRAALLEILDLTDEGGAPIQAEAEARLIMSICKGAAIKGGQTMALDEMRALIRDLEKCVSPRTCPHGRPTMLQLNAALLEREFGRRG